MPVKETVLADARVCIITNMPTHYRAPVFDRLDGDRYTIVYCARVEPARQWTMPALRHRAVFLGERHRAAADGVGAIHDNRDVWRVLDGLAPTVVVIGGLNPTHLYALAWAKRHGARLMYMTDGTDLSEHGLSWRHRLLRRLAFSLCHRFVVASSGGQRLLEGYGVDRQRIHLSRLCCDPPVGTPARFEDRGYDVMFCGRLQDVKMPLFFASVCAALRQKRGRCRALVAGDGPDREATLAQLRAAGVEVDYLGFVPPGQLRAHYASARLLLFPTAREPWGLVANEALSAGTPVITTPEAGCAGDLVRDGVNGRVLPASVDAWRDAAAGLLGDPVAWQHCADAAIESVRPFNHDAAASALAAACEAA